MPTRCSCHPRDSPAEAPDAHLPDPASAAGRAEQTVGEIVRLCPEGLAVLQRLGIDHCCSAQLTLAQAAAAAGLDLESVVRALEGAGTAIPQAIAGLPLSRQVRLDVRDEIRQGREPFGRIMAAVNALDPGEALVLRAPFEPTPLFRVLARRGFASWIERRALDDCVVWFFRAGTESAPTIAAPTSPTADLATTLDVRGLEPPEPM